MSMRRAVLSCDACRTRKVRCDRRLPCHNCVLRGCNCEWSEAEATNSPSLPVGNHTAASISALESRVEALRGVVAILGGELGLTQAQCRSLETEAAARELLGLSPRESPSLPLPVRPAAAPPGTTPPIPAPRPPAPKRDGDLLVPKEEEDDDEDEDMDALRSPPATATAPTTTAPVWPSVIDSAHAPRAHSSDPIHSSGVVRADPNTTPPAVAEKAWTPDAEMDGEHEIDLEDYPELGAVKRSFSSASALPPTPRREYEEPPFFAAGGAAASQPVGPPPSKMATPDRYWA